MHFATCLSVVSVIYYNKLSEQRRSNPYMNKNNKKLIIASQNRHKIEEFGKILSKYGFDVIGRDDANIPTGDVEETGKTFEENSLLKAGAIFDLSHTATLADDSGLCVDFLDGAPGIYSARFAGDDTCDSKNNEKLLNLMEAADENERTARFVCVITLILETGEKIVTRGECEGKIARAETGKNGFGYDPLFIPNGYDVSMAQLPPDEKNKISHRAKAIEKLINKISKKI